MTNKFAGKCTTCGTTVPVGMGNLTKQAGGYTVAHASSTECFVALGGTHVPAARPAVTEAGIYRLDGTFWKVQAGKGGWLYAKQVLVRTVGGKAKVRFVYRAGAIAKLSSLDKLTFAQAKEFGMLYGSCVNCGLALFDKEGRSQLAGYGKVCADKYGWPYPTAADVRAALLVSA